MKIFLFSLLLICSAKSFAQGKLCIKKLPDNYETSSVRAPVKDFFYVQIDKNEKIKLGQVKTVCVDNLSLKKKHLIKIYEGKVLKESFWFTFDRTKEKYLQYNDFYGTWMLRD